MAKPLTPSQQFALQQKIARKSIREFQPKIKEALQADFDKAAQMVEALGVEQAANNRAGFFTGDKINNILRTLYESTGGYTAMRYQQMFETNRNLWCSNYSHGFVAAERRLVPIRTRKDGCETRMVICVSIPIMRLLRTGIFVSSFILQLATRRYSTVQVPGTCTLLTIQVMY